MAVEIRRVGVRRVERILLDPGETLAGGVGEVGLRGLRRVGPRDQRMRCALVHHRIVVPAALGHADRRGGAIIAHPVELLLERRFGGADEIDPLGLLIDAGDLLDGPVATRQLGPSARPPAVEVRKAAPLRRPDQAAVLQRLEVLGEVHPGRRGFREQQH